MKVRIFGDLGTLLNPNGAIVSLVSSPDIYTHKWASFSTQDFPRNAAARSGDVVRIIVTDHEGHKAGRRHPLHGRVLSGGVQAGRSEGGLHCSSHSPRETSPYRWVNETKIPPWVIYVLKRIANHQLAGL